LTTELAELVLGRAMRRPKHYPGLHRLTPRLFGNPGHTHLGDGRMRRENLLDFSRPDLIATRLDQILLAVHDVEISVLVQIAEIARMKPAACAARLDMVPQHS